MFAKNIENSKKLKYYIFKEKTIHSIFYCKCGHQYEKIFKEEESIKN